MEKSMNLENLIEEYNLNNEIIEVRRHIHKNPELSEQEKETSQYICHKLGEWGIEYKTGYADTGVVAIVKGAKDGKTVAIRGDMDALPIEETTELEYASINEGVMHACGHDAHVAILLITAKVANLMKEQLKGNVKFFFQPAEESIGGAKRMIEDGCMENPTVDYVLGLHVEPLYDTGIVGIKYGKMYAASDMIDLTINGKSSHGAHPEEGVDTVTIAANIINSIQTVVSRKVSPLNSALCTFGTIKGGTVRNQIADKTKLKGIIRTLDQETRLHVRENIKSISVNLAEAMGATVDFDVIESYGSLINDDKITKIVEKNAKKLLGDANVHLESFPDLSCEDFSYFAMEKPSCYFHLGCYDESNGERVDLHNPKFKIDEECLMLGVKLQLENVISLLKREN